MKRSYKYSYQVRIDPDTLPELQTLSASLGFLVENPGATQGNPSPAAFLDALAAAHRADPAGLVATLAAALAPTRAEAEAAALAAALAEAEAEAEAAQIAAADAAAKAAALAARAAAQNAP